MANEEDYVFFKTLSRKWRKMMKWLHETQPQAFEPELLREPVVKEFIKATAEVLNEAVDEGLKIVSLDEVSRQRLKDSNFVFSGYKTFHELNEVFPSLLDEGGAIKPFEHFLKDVQAIHENYNKYYLKSEYKFATQSSLMAARWKSFNPDKRYNLQYRTIGDERVRFSHRPLDRITLPMTSKFWDWYFPPNGWGCRCTVVQVRGKKYPVSDEADAMNAGSQSTAGKHQEMFRFNPGKEMATFPAYNPYTIRSCIGCEYQPMKLARNERPNNEQCAACKIIQEGKSLKDFKSATKEAYQWISDNVPEKGYTLPATNKKSQELRVSRGSLKDVVDHFRRSDEKMVIEQLVGKLSDRKYTHSALLGEGKKGDSEKIKKNLKKKRQRGVVSYNYYSIMIDGENWELNCEVFKKGFEKTYALRKKRTNK